MVGIRGKHLDSQYKITRPHVSTCQRGVILPIGAVSIWHDGSFFFPENVGAVGTIDTGFSYGGQSEKMVPLAQLTPLVVHNKPETRMTMPASRRARARVLVAFGRLAALRPRFDRVGP